MCPFAVYAKRQSGLVNPDYAKALEGLPQFIRDDGTVIDKGKILLGFFFLENSGEPVEVHGLYARLGGQSFVNERGFSFLLYV